MRKKILIVDDTPDLLDNLAAFLSLEGFDVLMCANGREALDKVQDHAPDLVITDLWMPEMDGFEMIEALRKMSGVEKTPIAVFSAAPIQQAERNRLKGKVNGYIKKPIETEDMLKEINNYLKQS